ncbi:TOBE domain-containing protein [Massilia norwichensis]|uniref:TOBE domain-containing protein n=1 Tax=Massilia norwichensis TaxID=1442366 RepID=A0ABT2ADT9_9BURK|nr:TOBE domain-containing protein [Massilia norwichensis]MCS0592374.1 TOBE domain-containing protein [Massilia norwichensis]
MEKQIELQGMVWMTVGGEKFGGPGRIDLLAGIAATGSITQAAKAVKMSYKAAWDAIDAMNNLAGEALVERQAGGKGGGGTRLTPRGEQLVKNFRLLDRIHHDFVQQLNRQAAGIADDLHLIGRLNMKTSARNQFFGTVAGVKTGAVNDEVELDIAGGHRLVAIVTHESTESLGLEVGRQAFALIKSSSIILVTQAEGARFSARNRLQGRVARLTPGAVNTEVVLDLAGGGTVAAIITNESAQALELAEGRDATAMFKASSVIVGVTG